MSLGGYGRGGGGLKYPLPPMKIFLKATLPLVGIFEEIFDFFG